jgi:serine/threonine protein kinase
VAVKIMSGMSAASVREITLLKKFSGQCPYIVRMIDHYVTQRREPAVVLELGTKTLTDHIRHSRLMPKDILKVLHDVTSGLVFLHGNNIFHRDLKPCNIIIVNGIFKIIDFGMACCDMNNNPKTIEVQTLWYRAPEVLLGQVFYTDGVDMWSLGAILYYMSTGCVPFHPQHPSSYASNSIDMLELLFRECGYPNEETWPGVSQLPVYTQVTKPSQTHQPLSRVAFGIFCKFMDQLLVMDPSRRIKARELMKQILQQL